jgi:hypothetical protein
VRIGAFVLSLALASCASHQYTAHKGHVYFQNKDFERAAEVFAKDASTASSNQVLFLLDYGTSLFAAQKYDEAIDVFLRAERLTEVKDYTSISEEVGVLATGSNVRGYKGEDFEKVLINVYLSLAFAALGKTESAQVEARKINNLLHRMIVDGKRNYQESSFARYLSALMWESSGEWNSAYIDYKKTHELEPDFPNIGSDLLAMANKMRFHDEYKKWTEQYPGSKPRKFERDEGELVVIFERGLSPIKMPRSEESTLPRFVHRYSPIRAGRVVVNDSVSVVAEKALDIEQLSTKYLEDRIGRMRAAKIAGLALKGAAAYATARLTDNDDLGILAFYLLMATDQADLRSWRSLPQSLDIARIPLKAGTHFVRVESLNSAGDSFNATHYEAVQIRPGKKVFIVSR